MSRFIKRDYELFLKIANDVKEYPSRYAEPGKWLDRYYKDAELLCKKQAEIEQQKYGLMEEIKEAEGQSLEGKLFTSKHRLEFISQFSIKDIPPLRERLAYALEDLFGDYVDTGVLSEVDAKAVILITWIATDPEANRANLSLTNFAEIVWKAETGVSEEIRFGLAPFLFFDLDIALHYKFWCKPGDDWYSGPIYEMDLNYLPMIHRAWAKRQREQETGTVEKGPARAQKVLRREADIVAILKKNPDAKQADIAKELGCSAATVSRSKVWKMHRAKPPQKSFPDHLAPE
jgi:hypothetical protein